MQEQPVQEQKPPQVDNGNPSGISYLSERQATERQEQAPQIERHSQRTKWLGKAPQSGGENYGQSGSQYRKQQPNRQNYLQQSRGAVVAGGNQRQNPGPRGPILFHLVVADVPRSGASYRDPGISNRVKETTKRGD
jgi:hypothetical protein